jgi:GTP-binding protein
MQVTTLLLCAALQTTNAFIAPKTTIRVKCPALQAQQDDESRSRRGRRRERKKDAVAIDAPAVDAPRKKIKRPAFLEKKPRRKVEPEKPEAPIEPVKEDFASQCREQLIQLYERYNPDKVKDVDDLLRKYAGREPLLISAVEAKYSGAQGVPLFKDEALVRAGAELVEREAEAREAERMAARLRAERAEAACLEEGVDLEEAVAAVCAEAGASQALERVVAALFDADPSQASAVVQQTPIDLRWVEGDVFGAFGGPGAALAAGWFYTSVSTPSTRLTHPTRRAQKGRAAPTAQTIEASPYASAAASGVLDALREGGFAPSDVVAACVDACAKSDIYTRNEVLRHLAALGCYREVLAIDAFDDIEKDAAHHEHVNRALVRNVDRGPTADSMQRLPPPGAPEVVLLGRSNVGKSSLANALLGRRALAPASPVPGRTRRFCFYDVDVPQTAGFRLVDVPGAGFAVDNVTQALEGKKAGTAVGKVDSWRSLVLRYLDVREPLKVVLQLVDARRCLDATLPEADLSTLETVAGSEAIKSGRAAHVLVLTKGDKLSAVESTRAVEALTAVAAGVYGGASPSVVLTAATARPPVGRSDAWRAVLSGLGYLSSE